MAADCFISLSKSLRFFCQLFSRVDLTIMFNFFALEKMVETPKFSFWLHFFLFIISVTLSIFLRLFCETAVVFKHLCFPLKFCAGNWRTAGQNWFICGCCTFDRSVIGAYLIKLNSFEHKSFFVFSGDMTHFSLWRRSLLLPNLIKNETRWSMINQLVMSARSP